MQDPIADMLSRIRNAIAVNQASVSLPYSNLKERVANILQKNGYLVSVSAEGKDLDKRLVLVINDETVAPKITSLRRMSKPGRRLYVSTKEIPVVKRGRGMVVLSTSKGLMSGQEARNQQLGGEVVCEVY